MAGLGRIGATAWNGLEVLDKSGISLLTKSMKSSYITGKLVAVANKFYGWLQAAKVCDYLGRRSTPRNPWVRASAGLMTSVCLPDRHTFIVFRKAPVLSHRISSLSISNSQWGIPTFNARIPAIE
jgi:hypothetical protein